MRNTLRRQTHLRTVRLDGAELVPQRVVSRVVLESRFHVLDGFFVLARDDTQHSENDERFWLVWDNLCRTCGCQTQRAVGQGGATGKVSADTPGAARSEHPTSAWLQCHRTPVRTTVTPDYRLSFACKNVCTYV